MTLLGQVMNLSHKWSQSRYAHTIKNNDNQSKQLLSVYSDPDFVLSGLHSFQLLLSWPSGVQVVITIVLQAILRWVQGLRLSSEGP